MIAISSYIEIYYKKKESTGCKNIDERFLFRECVWVFEEHD